MRRTSLAGGFAAILLAGNAAAADARDAPVAVYVDGLQRNVAAQVVKHAQQGQRSLARYLERVRPYQRLAYEDVTRPPQHATHSIATPPREFRKHAWQWRPARPVEG